MNITQAGRALGVTPRTLRHYEAEGLLKPSRRDNGYRHYSPREIERAEWIRDFMASGFSARELRGILHISLPDPDHQAIDCGAIMQSKLEQIERLIGALTGRKQSLAEKLRNWEMSQVPGHDH